MYAGQSLYRVFILPGLLQVDLSFTPEDVFSQQGQAFRLLFGTAIQAPTMQSASPSVLLGYAVHHLLRARICIERGRVYQAEYWLHSARDYALSLARTFADLPVSYGRGFDKLPSVVTILIPACFTATADSEGLMTALRATVDLVRHMGATNNLVSDVVKENLANLKAPWAEHSYPQS